MFYIWAVNIFALSFYRHFSWKICYCKKYYLLCLQGGLQFGSVHSKKEKRLLFLIIIFFFFGFVSGQLLWQASTITPLSNKECGDTTSSYMTFPQFSNYRLLPRGCSSNSTEHNKDGENLIGTRWLPSMSTVRLLMTSIAIRCQGS